MSYKLLIYFLKPSLTILHNLLVSILMLFEGLNQFEGNVKIEESTDFGTLAEHDISTSLSPSR